MKKEIILDLDGIGARLSSLEGKVAHLDAKTDTLEVVQNSHSYQLDRLESEQLLVKDRLAVAYKDIMEIKSNKNCVRARDILIILLFIVIFIYIFHNL